MLYNKNFFLAQQPKSLIEQRTWLLTKTGLIGLCCGVLAKLSSHLVFVLEASLLDYGPASGNLIHLIKPSTHPLGRIVQLRLHSHNIVFQTLTRHRQSPSAPPSCRRYGPQEAPEFGKLNAQALKYVWTLPVITPVN